MKLLNQKGQTVILLLLVMVIGLTVGLSVVSRSVLDVKLSSQSEESSRAFTAAEAGVEVALEQGLATIGTIEGDVGPADSLSHYTCTRLAQAAGLSYYVFPYKVEKDKAAQFYFASASDIEKQDFDGNKIRIVWGNSGTDKGSSTAPALEVSLIYKEEDTYKVAKFALDPNETRRGSNNFCSPVSCVQTEVSNFATNGTDIITTSDAEVKFQFGADINVTAFNSGPTKFLQIGRFRLLYNENSPAVLGIKSFDDKTFTSQGTVIDCLGERIQSGVQRRVKVYENFPSLPDVFDYVLFNGNPSRSLGH